MIPPGSQPEPLGGSLRTRRNLLRATFVPRQHITSSWLKVAADINPMTYVFNAMPSVLIDGWRVRPLLIGLAVVLAVATVTGALALWQARRAAQLR
jgi:ABC-2 type transport system permease protein